MKWTCWRMKLFSLHQLYENCNFWSVEKEPIFFCKFCLRFGWFFSPLYKTERVKWAFTSAINPMHCSICFFFSYWNFNFHSQNDQYEKWNDYDVRFRHPNKWQGQSPWIRWIQFGRVARRWSRRNDAKTQWQFALLHQRPRSGSGVHTRLGHAMGRHRFVRDDHKGHHCRPRRKGATEFGHQTQ